MYLGEAYASDVLINGEEYYYLQIQESFGLGCGLKILPLPRTALICCQAITIVFKVANV